MIIPTPVQHRSLNNGYGLTQEKRNGNMAEVLEKERKSKEKDEK